MSGEPPQTHVDAANADFWAELCGSHLARELGVEDASAASLARFDRAYFDRYPYLERYLPWRAGERVLEIGLGYGTVGHLLAGRGLDYHGLDISAGPVAMMAHRLELLGFADATARTKQGSALAVPHPDESFDAVVTIGCLHHAGDLAGAVEEVRRVLRPGGEALVMVYNRHSFRHIVLLPGQAMRRGVWRDRERRDEFIRAAYDVNAAGSAAPSTVYTSAADIRRMFAGFSGVRVRREGFDDVGLRVGRRTVAVPGTVFRNNLARIAGSDLYVTARK